jgi:hypothetical protein
MTTGATSATRRSTAGERHSLLRAEVASWLYTQRASLLEQSPLGIQPLGIQAPRTAARLACGAL